MYTQLATNLHSVGELLPGMIFANKESLRTLQYEVVQQNEIKLTVDMLFLQCPISDEVQP